MNPTFIDFILLFVSYLLYDFIILVLMNNCRNYREKDKWQQLLLQSSSDEKAIIMLPMTKAYTKVLYNLEWILQNNKFSRTFCKGCTKEK